MGAVIGIGIAGALGRMGRAVAAVLEGRKDTALVARFGRPGSTGDGLTSAEGALEACDVIVDFTPGDAAAAIAAQAAAAGRPALVIGSTGLSAEAEAAIAGAAQRIAIVKSGNF